MIVGLVSSKEKLEMRFEAQVPEEIECTANYNIRPGDDCLFLASDDMYHFGRMRYGMVPFWSNKEKFLYEAPIEGHKHEESFKKGIILDNAFRKPIREQRGILPVDYFILNSNDGKPYLVYLKEKQKRPIALACLWDTWQKVDTGELYTGFCVINTPSYGKFKEIGLSRMPIVIHENRCRKWLKNGLLLTEVTELIVPYPEELLNAFPISPEILTNKENDKKLIEANGKPIEHEKPVVIPKQTGWFHRRKKLDDNESWAEKRKNSL